jgi:hypothetical protein
MFTAGINTSAIRKDGTGASERLRPTQFWIPNRLNGMLSRPSLSFAGRVYWHDGGSPRFYSILIALPDLKLGAIVLSNSDGGMINVGLIADEILKHAAAVKTGQNVPVLKNSLVAAQIKKNKEEKFVTGRFASAHGMVKIIQHNHAVRAIIQGQ